MGLVLQWLVDLVAMKILVVKIDPKNVDCRNFHVKSD